MLQNLFRKLLGLRICHVFFSQHAFKPASFIPTRPDGGSHLKTSKISLGIRIQSLIQKSAHHISLDVKRSRGDIHHVIQALIKFLRVLERYAICGILIVTTPTEPVLSPATKKPPLFLRSSRRSRRRRSRCCGCRSVSYHC